MFDIDIKEYHKKEGISSTTLKTIMKSPAHLQYVIDNGYKPTKATSLGDAFHAWILQPERFDSMYEEVSDVYVRNIGEHKIGDPKLDEDGDPIVMLKHKEDSRLDIKGEEYKKFRAMVKAYNESESAIALVKKAKYVEQSFFVKHGDELLKVRPDFITDDGWIVDVKTVGGTADKPSSPENFCRDFFHNGYDLQMFMYHAVVSEELPDIKGFKFLCFDAKIISGVQIYTFINGESDWFELGGHRFMDALNRYKKFKEDSVHKLYETETPDGLELSYAAEDALAEYRNA